MKSPINEVALPPIIADMITDQEHYLGSLFADTYYYRQDKRPFFKSPQGIRQQFASLSSPELAHFLPALAGIKPPSLPPHSGQFQPLG